MARRRSRLSGALAGLGEGITNAGDILLRTMMQDRLQSRYDERAAKSAEAVATRQQDAADQAAIQKIIDEVAAGTSDPSSAATRISARTGRQVDPSSLESVRPSPRRRMEKAIGGDIAKATSPEMVPGDLDIASIARSEGIRERFPNLPAFATEGMEPASGAFADLDPIAAEYGQRGAQRRSALEAKPTESVDVTTPTGGKRREFASRYGGPIEIEPSAQQQGVFAGQKKVGELESSGDALAAQAGKETTARTQAELAPEFQQARTREAVNKEVQTLKATLPMQLELATKKAAIELQQAVNKENASNVAAGVRAAQQLAPFFNKVADITAKLNDKEGAMARVKGAVLTAKGYAGYAPLVTELNQLIAQNLRPLAVAAGVREANVSERETAQALNGIGLSQWKTATERRNGLRNLQDLITLSPAIAARMPADAGIGERVSLAQQWMQQRRTAEQEAIASGAPSYIDPIMGGILAVIK